MDEDFTFPVELEPNKMVNAGSPSRVRSRVSISALRGKNVGRREKVCLGRSLARSLVSVISRRASSNKRLDSVKERTVCAGCGYR